jgi:hypothetical protein
MFAKAHKTQNSGTALFSPGADVGFSVNSSGQAFRGTRRNVVYYPLTNQRAHNFKTVNNGEQWRVACGHNALL